MAIAFDAILINPSTVVIPASNPIVFAGTEGAIGSDDETGATIGGVAMTLVDKQLCPGTNGRFSYLWVLQAPPTGSQAFAVQPSGYAGAAVITYTGAAQSGQVDAHNKSTSTGATVAVSVTTVADNCWVTGYIDTQDGNKPTAGSGTTSRSAADTQTFFDSNGVVTPAGSKTLNGNSTSGGVSFICASFKPFVAPTTNGNFLSFL